MGRGGGGGSQSYTYNTDFQSNTKAYMFDELDSNVEDGKIDIKPPPKWSQKKSTFDIAEE